MTPIPPGARVLMVSRHSYPTQTVTRRNAEHLAGLGLRVDLICLGARPDPTQGEPPPGLRVFRVPVRQRRGLPPLYLFEYTLFGVAAFALATLLSLRHRYLTVQVDNLPDLLVLAALAGRLRGARVVLNLVELNPERSAARIGVRSRHPLVLPSRLCERLALALSDHVVTVSPTSLRILCRRGLDPARVTVVPNGVPVRQPLASERRPTPTPPRLVIQAQLIKRHGVQIAIRAMVSLRRDWPDLTLLVIGDGEYKPQLVRLAARLRVRDRVRFAGLLPREDARQEVWASTIGLVPVIRDGYGELLLPSKLLEMVEQEVPVVCAHLPAIVECFGEDALGYFAPGDPTSLAASVDRVLRDAGLRRALTGRARVAARGCRWAAVSGRYVAALMPSAALPVVSKVASRP